MQHMSILPMAAQIEVKSATSVGMGDAEKEGELAGFLEEWTRKSKAG